MAPRRVRLASSAGSREPDGCFVLFGLVWSCDTGAYFVGRAIGRRKLHAQVSPGKTVEGYYGGIAVAARGDGHPRLVS